MKRSTLRILSAPLLIAGALALPGCGKVSSTPTTISYKQIGICKTYVTPASTQEAKPNEGFAIFKIVSVDNTENGSIFYFDPVRFYVNQSKPEEAGNIYKQNRKFINSNTRLGNVLGVKYADKITVPNGGKVEDAGFALIELGLNNPSGGPEADKYNFIIAYDTGTGDRGSFDSVNEGIKLVREPSDTQYNIVENCKDLPLR